MKSKLKFLAILVILAAAALFAANYYRTFYKNNLAKEGTVQIHKNISYEEFCTVLSSSGILANEESFFRAADAMNLSSNFKPGNYLFKGARNNKSIIRTFQNGWQTPVKLIIKSHTRTIEKVAGTLATQLEVDSTDLNVYFHSNEMYKKLGLTSESFIGIIIPDTYEVYWTITPESLVEKLYKEYEKFWNEDRCSKAEKAGLSREEVMTLASIVVEETNYEPEMPRVAGVYINRLNKGMPLQADPTVKYALKGEDIRRILLEHLNVDSPYNTYKHTGLSPGPITVPTKKGIESVLNYEHHNYLYFCAKPTFDGQHDFSVTLSQHNARAAAYHSALNAQQKAKSRSRTQ